jgi:FKBP-type peptidyl-prolyl cis-trans isomerase (trigger factor)
VWVRVPPLAPIKKEYGMAIAYDVAASEQILASQKKIQPILDFHIVRDRPGNILLTVSVPSAIIDAVFDAAAHAQQKNIKAPGFDLGKAPIEFLKQNYQTSLLEHLKEFLFKYCILNGVYRTIREKGLIIAGEPRITNIALQPNNNALFHFECTVAENVPIHEWRYFPFRAPKRKNYKDLDRQVENFIIEETELHEKKHTLGIQENDWIALEIELANSDGTSLIPGFSQSFWLKISDEHVDNPLRDLLHSQQVGFSTVTQNKGLQDYFSEQLVADYWYTITVSAHVPHAYFCFEQFKQHFKIKTKKELLKKLIEVFSYRNDISQRRAMVEECLKLLLTKHPFEVPSHVKTRFQEAILLNMHDSPDYNVYRTQKDFESLIKELAEKGAKEAILLDTLAFNENIGLTKEDLSCYLNFTKRGRSKEFIYCEFPVHVAEGQSTLIAEEELMRYCLREKTLNHIIYHLTKE